MSGPNTSKPPLPHFYLRYYVGHKGKFGHEFLEWELRPNGVLRYANNSNYRNDSLIRRECTITAPVMEHIAEMIRQSGIMALLQEEEERGENADKYASDCTPRMWPRPDRLGRQELEIVLDGKSHIRVSCAQFASLAHVPQRPRTLDAFYYIVQDLKTFILTLMSMHFKVKPIQ